MIWHMTWLIFVPFKVKTKTEYSEPAKKPLYLFFLARACVCPRPNLVQPCQINLNKNFLGVFLWESSPRFVQGYLLSIPHKISPKINIMV